MKNVLIVLLAGALLLGACGAGQDPNRVTDLDLARRTLVDFFEAVADGEYQAAVALHGENEDFYQFARENNPDVNPDDRAALLRASCERQLVCLQISSILSAEQVSGDEFLFTVQFINPDGSLYIMNPCCGEDAAGASATSEFEYRVERVDDEYFVLGGPLYVP